MKTVPHYALYGEQEGAAWSDGFVFEWIPQRSAPYNWEIQPHVHGAFIQILYLESGSVQAQIGNHIHKATAPCLIVVPAQTIHSFHFSPDVNGPVITAGQQFLESMAAVAMPALQQVIRTPLVIEVDSTMQHVRALRSLALEVEREWKTFATGQSAAGMALIMALLVQVARIRRHASPQAELPGYSRKVAQIEKFRTLIDAHFKDKASVAFYAGKIGVTSGQLTRICREVLDRSALDLINARVISEAERDLIYTVQPVKQIAAFLGFDDEAYFSRFFRKHTGMSPRDFRTRMLAEITSAHAA